MVLHQRFYSLRFQLREEESHLRQSKPNTLLDDKSPVNTVTTVFEKVEVLLSLCRKEIPRRFRNPVTSFERPARDGPETITRFENSLGVKALRIDGARELAEPRHDIGIMFEPPRNVHCSI